jgi:hypothetical protein
MEIRIRLFLYFCFLLFHNTCMLALWTARVAIWLLGSVELLLSDRAVVTDLRVDGRKIHLIHGLLTESELATWIYV